MCALSDRSAQRWVRAVASATASCRTFIRTGTGPAGFTGFATAFIGTARAGDIPDAGVTPGASIAIVEASGLGAELEIAHVRRFGALDQPVVAGAPDFEKALGLDHARDGEVMIAFGMNGEQLPLLNGFPIKLVVPGWVATYWIKMLSDIEVLDQPERPLDQLQRRRVLEKQRQVVLDTGRCNAVADVFVNRRA